MFFCGYGFGEKGGVGVGAVSDIKKLGGNVHPYVRQVFENIDKNPPGEFGKFEVSGGSIFRIVEGYRHPGRQPELIKKGLSKANPCASYHNWGLAVDVVFRRFGYGQGVVDGETYDMARVDGWLKTGFPQYMESLGFTWGGRFTVPDCAHFEYRIKVPREKQYAYNLGAILGVRWWSEDIKDYVDVVWHQYNKNVKDSVFAGFFSGFLGKAETVFWVAAVIYLWKIFKD
jgi:hypothetical protein